MELATYFAWAVPVTFVALALYGWARHLAGLVRKQEALAEDHQVSLSTALDRIKDRCDQVAEALPVLPLVEETNDPYRRSAGPLRLRCPHCSLPVDVELAVPGDVPARIGEGPW